MVQSKIGFKKEKKKDRLQKNFFLIHPQTHNGDMIGCDCVLSVQ